jgi:hypothetical protein
MSKGNAIAEARRCGGRRGDAIRDFFTPRLPPRLCGSAIALLFLRVDSAIAFLFLCVGSAFAQSAQKHLIEFGWDEPDTAFMQKHIAQMEQTPFDGAVFHITYEKPDGSRGRFMNECWSDRQFTPAELKRAADELKQTKFTKFNQNFLRFNVVPGNVDWFDDFDAVMTNAFLAARIARDGKCRGVLFDIEQYDKPLWDYRKQKYASSRSWDEYAAQARDRGRLLMGSFQDGFGDNIVVFLTFGFSLPYSQTNGDAKKLPQVEYGLLHPFLDGMLDVAKPGAKIVDGFESSYAYKQRQEFLDARKTVTETIPALVSNPQKYRQTISLGFGLWMDYDWRHKGWDVTDLSKNFFSPAQFQTSVRCGLQTSDEFVWIYTEAPKWWSEKGPEKLPDAYLHAIENARGVEH